MSNNKNIFSSDNALEIGKAGEHLVCADLILKGYRAFLSDQGLPYDVVVDVDGRLIRVQVKSSFFERNVNSAARNERASYSWLVRRVGKNGKARLANADCDIIALVALDIRMIGYAPVTACSTCVQMPAHAQAGRFGITLSELSSFDKALSGFPVSLAVKGRRATIRRNGQLTLVAAGLE